MRLRSPLRGLVRRKEFGVRLGSQILRLGESEPPSPAWGGARRAQRPPRAPRELANQRSAQTFPNSPPPAVSQPPSREARLAARGSAGRGQGGVSSSLLSIPSGAGCHECVRRARGVAIPGRRPGRSPTFRVGAAGMGDRRGLGQPRAGLWLLLALLQLPPRTQAGEPGGRTKGSECGVQ